MWLILLAFWLTACTRTAPPLPTTPLTATAPPLAAATLTAAQALPALVLAERTAAGARDLATLRQLWAEDARIVDSRGTPDPADDYIWNGRDAILDRYGIAVRAGTHCAMPLLKRFGVTSTCRASFGLYTGTDDIDALVVGIEKARSFFA